MRLIWCQERRRCGGACKGRDAPVDDEGEEPFRASAWRCGGTLETSVDEEEAVGVGSGRSVARDCGEDSE